MSSASDLALQVNQLPISVEMPSDFSQFREIMSLLYKRIASSTNTKTGGVYDIGEFYNFNQFYTLSNPFDINSKINVFRNTYRKTFDVVALNTANIPGGATVMFNHDIVGLKYSTLVYASCTSVANDFFSVMHPYADMNATQIVFTNPLGATDLKSVIFVAEYLKT